MRLFFALWPPEEIVAAMSKVAVEVAQGCGGRAARPQTLHLTLAFLGEIAQERLYLVKEAAAQVDAGAFDLCLDKLGYWRHNQIFWVGCSQLDERLRQLAETLAQVLRQRQFILEERCFVPHVTLVRKIRTPPETIPAFTGMVWPCREFVLVQSVISDRGADYKKLASWRLAC